MAKLLPSAPDISAVEESEPRVIGVDSEDADEMLSALSSSTARKLLSELHEEPDSPSSLAERLDTSLQNIQYHLGKLEDADLVAVVDTVYSEKGREMKVYAPSNRPLVVFAGRESDSTGLKSALQRLLGGFGILGGMSLLVQYLLADGPLLGFGFGATGGDAATAESTQVAADSVAATAAAGTVLPPGLLFFLGGALMLTIAFAVWYARR
ncbi:Helix-turn-helix domain-containing protein [Halogranum rubrum]|uniref:Helix-turn-helix domain-containing protein n=1 Tax=Halogranum rubrum TaxID=553466 RepID=A0A1I4J2G2_9EURY|nr:winged helix-turn-helix domain-containing protein [Halogranum rubrum]SFL60417.1 Helix-turn-helix domain-containing protein [Halogranum rubrum]